MKAFAGTWRQIRLQLRLYRWSLVAWVVAIGTVFAAVAQSMASLYPDTESRQQYATLNEASPVLQAINGPGYALDTLGGIVLFEVGGFALIAIALMVTLGVSRATRAPEERGQMELVLASATGRLAPLTSAVSVMVVVAIGISALCVLGMVMADIPISGAATYALSMVALAVCFAGLTAFVAQLFPSGENTVSTVGMFLGVSYVMRGAGDLGDIELLTMASPFGWVQYAAPFSDDQRLWPLVLTIGVGVVLILGAMVIRQRRDLGAAVFARSLGPAQAGNMLRGVLTAAWRLTFPVMLGWALGAAFLGTLFGIAGDELSTLFEVNPDFALVLGADQGEVSDRYLRLVIQIIGLIATGYALALIQRYRTDEVSGLVELTLATATSRVKWLMAALVPALVGSAGILAAGAAALGASYAWVTEDAEALSRSVSSAMYQLPAVWFIVALAVGLFGAIPRFFLVVWVVYAVTAVIVMLGPALQLSEAVKAVSPFSYVPQLPEVNLSPESWWLVVAAAVFFAAGIFRVRRRDIGR